MRTLAKICLVVMATFLVVAPAHAGLLEAGSQGLLDATVGSVASLTFNILPEPQNALGSVVVTVLSTILGILGVVAVVFFVYAGVLWMTAGGNDQQIAKAKKIIIRTIIGIIIVTLAYAIITFFTTVFPSSPPAEIAPGTEPPGGG